MTIKSHPGSSSKSLTSSIQSQDLLTKSLGSNKTKSLLRQATRLLKKDGLSEELRKSTEQQIETLKATLENKPSKEQEKSNAIRYHRIKFFDRKKVHRKLDQVIRKLDKMSDSYTDDKKLARTHKKLTREAERLRIDLNYVNAYPKHLKYVSLYPNGNYAVHEELPADLPKLIPSTKKPDALRNYVRAYMADAMKKGTLSSQPELKKQPELEEEEQLSEDDDEVRNAKQTEELAADDFFST